MLSRYQQCAAKCPTKLFQLAAIKLLVANVNIPVPLLYAGFDVFVAISNPAHPFPTCHCTLPFATPLWGELILLFVFQPPLPSTL